MMAMDRKVTEVLTHMACSQQQLARILEAKREVAVSMAQLIQAMPDDHGARLSYEAVIENSSGVTKSLTNYLNSLADLEEALAGQLGHVMRELQADQEGE